MNAWSFVKTPSRWSKLSAREQLIHISGLYVMQPFPFCTPFRLKASLFVPYVAYCRGKNSKLNISSLMLQFEFILPTTNSKRSSLSPQLDESITPNKSIESAAKGSKVVRANATLSSLYYTLHLFTAMPVKAINAQLRRSTMDVPGIWQVWMWLTHRWVCHGETPQERPDEQC